MNPLDLIKLTSLMARSRGSPAVRIGLIDGPVATAHPDLARELLREIASDTGAACTNANSSACMHGTFVAGVLAARRTSSAPAICPDCTLLIRPIFAERITGSEQMPGATSEALAAAILDCIKAGARVINLSLALAQPSGKGERSLEDALDAAVRQSVIVVAAAGNQGTLGSSAITRHPWVIPVVGLRPSRQADERVEPRRLDRPARPDRTGRRHHQPEPGRTNGHARRNERRSAVRDRDDRAVVVGIPGGDGRADQAGDRPGFDDAPGFGRSASARRRGSL